MGNHVVDMLKNGIYHFKATASRTSPKSKSLRVTLPPMAVEAHGLKAGDELEWSFDAVNGNLWISEIGGKKIAKP